MCGFLQTLAIAVSPTGQSGGWVTRTRATPPSKSPEARRGRAQAPLTDAPKTPSANSEARLAPWSDPRPSPVGPRMCWHVGAQTQCPPRAGCTFCPHPARLPRKGGSGEAGPQQARPRWARPRPAQQEPQSWVSRPGAGAGLMLLVGGRSARTEHDSPPVQPTPRHTSPDVGTRPHRLQGTQAAPGASCRPARHAPRPAPCSGPAEGSKGQKEHQRVRTGADR